MTDRTDERSGVLPARPEIGGGAGTPSFDLPEGATPGMPGPAAPTRIGPREFAWGRRTYVMGILNVTPDSFSGDGLLRDGAGRSAGPIDAGPVDSAVALGRQMVEDGADLLDVGGESSRPGHGEVSAADEIARVVPVIAALRAALPETPLSVDTTKPAVAAAALDAGADLVNDVWGVAVDDELLRLAAKRRAPIVLMHNRAEARYTNLMPEILAGLQAAIERALRAGVAWDAIIVDPGFGFGKTPAHNLALLRELSLVQALGRPILLGTSRKSTLGKVLDLDADERLEATLATTALGIAAGVDIVRVHDVRPNVRAARMADAIVRGGSLRPDTRGARVGPEASGGRP
jgi:dihydropteroate synthase